MMQIFHDKNLFIAVYSKTGSGHFSRGEENQDRCLYGRIGKNTFYLALADGVSSAPYAAEGAEAAVQTIKIVSEDISAGKMAVDNLKDLQTTIVRTWKNCFSTGWNDYAATLNLVIFHNNRVLVGRIGDGLIVSETDGACCVSATDEEFYSTETAALGEVVSRKDFEICLYPAEEAFCAYMVSDGIGKEIAESSRKELNRYLLQLSQTSEKQMEQEVVSWVNGLDRKNGDDKTIGFVRWEEL